MKKAILILCTIQIVFSLLLIGASIISFDFTFGLISLSFASFIYYFQESSNVFELLRSFVNLAAVLLTIRSYFAIFMAPIVIHKIKRAHSSKDLKRTGVLSIFFLNFTVSILLIFFLKDYHLIPKKIETLE